MNLLEIISRTPSKFKKEIPLDGVIRIVNLTICSFIKIDPDPANIEVLDERLYLNSGELGEIVFNYNYERIDYLCKIHRREVNSITIFTEDYKNMSNTQRLRYLRKRYNIKIPNLSIYLDGNR